VPINRIDYDTFQSLASKATATVLVNLKVTYCDDAKEAGLLSNGAVKH
jgi:hypothetical protein